MSEENIWDTPTQQNTTDDPFGNMFDDAPTQPPAMPSADDDDNAFSMNNLYQSMNKPLDQMAGHQQNTAGVQTPQPQYTQPVPEQQTVTQDNSQQGAGFVAEASSYNTSANPSSKFFFGLIAIITVMILIFLWYSLTPKQTHTVTSSPAKQQGIIREKTSDIVLDGAGTQINILANYEKVAVSEQGGIIQYTLKCQSSVGSFVVIVTNTTYNSIDTAGIIPIICTTYTLDDKTYYTNFILNPNYKEIMAGYL